MRAENRAIIARRAIAFHIDDKSLLNSEEGVERVAAVLEQLQHGVL